MLACCAACAQAAVVLAHMDLTDPLVFVILSEIRSIKGNAFPVIFITGHTHTRGMNIHKVSCICRDSTVSHILTMQYTHSWTHMHTGYIQLDAHAVSLEGGHYLDTIGFVSLTNGSVFQHRYTTSASPPLLLHKHAYVHTHTHTILIHYSCGVTE